MAHPLVLLGAAAVLTGIASGLSRRDSRPGGKQAMPEGVGQAAAALGVAPDRLWRTLSEAGWPEPDLAAAAAHLGVGEGALRAALPRSPRPCG